MTKKKKVRLSEEASPQQPAADYVVGQVSQSLFPKKQSSSSSGGSLSALFAAAPAATTVLFQPAPEPPQRLPEETPPKASAEAKDQPGQKLKKKPSKEKTSAELKLENREAGLQNADEDERVPAAKKRKAAAAAEAEEERGAEHYVMKRQKLRAQKEEEALKSRRTVFVGNLPISCTKKTLRSLFAGSGSIESIRFRSLVREDPSMSRKVAAIKRKVHPKKQSINAYVVFREEGGVAKALERNGVEIAQDFHVRVDRVTGTDAHDHKRSVFVGNLSFEMSELALRRHFEQCGSVEAVRLIRDQNSGLGKGFGYVLFESADSVQLALELDGSKLDGRGVRVRRSLKKEKLKNAEGREKGAKKGPKKGPASKGPTRGSRPPKTFSGKSSAFKGEMADPNKKMKKKPQKKKPRLNRKKVHL